MMRAYKYRLYPNKEQERRLTETLETCRHTYNAALAERIRAYKEEGKGLSYADQCKHLAAAKTDWQKAVHSQVVQDALRRLSKTYQTFFDARMKGKAHGFPRFKPSHRYNSFCFPQAGFKIVGVHLRLFKIGDVRITLHRPTEGRIKTCSIVRDVDQWYAVLTCETEPIQTAAEFPEATVGVDVGIKAFLTLSTGEAVGNPHHLRRSEARLKQLQRRLSRKKKGSKNRQKARIKVARCHRRVRRQRQDFLHKVSAKLARIYGTIVFEKLNIRGMVKNHRLAKSISDAAWNKLITFTIYKAESAGGRVELVDARNTSQDCSGCGVRVPKPLSERTHSCPSCGLVLDRDHNAALNIGSKYLSRSERPGLRVEAV